MTVLPVDLTSGVPTSVVPTAGLVGDPDAVRRQELASFLRSRRERLAPEQVGLPVGGRRRTPGLRREEVALLAGVGVTWYTWLEQGRDIRVSQQVVDAIARTLLLDRAERLHLFTLAGAVDATPPVECATVTPALRTVLDQLSPLPACVQNARYDVLAWNDTYNHLITDYETLPVEERNCLWLMFTHPDWRRSVVDWDAGACRMVAQFRAHMAEHVAETSWKGLVRQLRAASPEFRELWAQHEVQSVDAPVKRIRNRHVGLVKLTATSTWLAPRVGARLVVYTPHDPTSARRLDELAAAAASGLDAGRGRVP